MENKLNDAVEVLLDQLKEQDKQVADTKRTVNALLRRMGREPMFEDTLPESIYSVKVRRDEYYGKPFATAAQMFLQRRKEAMTPSEILKGLEEGGFDFRALGWQDNDRLRSLAISLAKNNKVFHKLPNGTFGLLDWYENIKRKPQDESTENANGK
jgi:hypothetical protein